MFIWQRKRSACYLGCLGTALKYSNPRSVRFAFFDGPGGSAWPLMQLTAAATSSNKRAKWFMMLQSGQKFPARSNA